jgi:hypothetical protein
VTNLLAAERARVIALLHVPPAGRAWGEARHGTAQHPEAGQQTKTNPAEHPAPEQHPLVPVQTSPFEQPPASMPAQLWRQT